MASIKKRMDAKKKKEVITALQKIQERIKSGELEIEWFGMWAGMPGQWNVKLTLKEKDFSEKS